MPSVPASHCAALRDNVPALVWLFSNGYVTNLKESCGRARNLLHVAIDEESPKTLRRVLTDRRLVRWTTLCELLRARDISRNETPFGRACSRQDPAMLFQLVYYCPMEFVEGKQDLTGMGKSVFNFVMENVQDSMIAINVMREFMKRGARPNILPWDSYSPLETVIETEAFTAEELVYTVKVSFGTSYSAVLRRDKCL